MIEQREKLLTVLVEEYKILQEKIDKIGAFRFTIKGWSLTLVAATLVAGGAAKISPKWLLITLLLAFTIIFFWIEKSQTDLSRRFGERARHLEGTLTGALRVAPNGTRIEEFRILGMAPGIVFHLRKSPGVFARFSQWLEQRARRKGWESVRTFLRSWFWRGTSRWIAADLWFYLLQAVAIVLVGHYLQPLGDSDKAEVPATINAPITNVLNENSEKVKTPHHQAGNRQPSESKHGNVKDDHR